MSSTHHLRTPPYLLIELANAHGGDLRLLEDMIAAYSDISYAQKGLKFQAFAADMIALPDYPSYDLYRRLGFDLDTWAHLVGLARESGDVWLDIFDAFGASVLEHNHYAIRGIKLQPSVLENLEVRDALQRVGIADKEVILNVSGLAIPVVRHLVAQFRVLSMQLFLQVGFQAYPTKVEDTGLGKLQLLRDADLGCKLALADHADGTTQFARLAPAMGYLLGCDLVEKHFVVDRSLAPFDTASALEPGEMLEALQNLLNAHAATTGPFVSDDEASYLASTIQQPVARRRLLPGELVAPSDLLFRRSGQSGLDFAEIRDLQQGRMVLDRTVPINTVFQRSGYRHARIAAVVAGRMKSTRLPRKALLPIGGVPSIERCLLQCSGIRFSHHTILATSNLADDDDLATLAYARVRGDLVVSRGDPTDVIHRYINAAHALSVDVVVRTTADNPFVLTEIADLLLEAHFAEGADYTAAREFAVGTSVEIMNVAALKRIKEHFGRCEHSEYMTWYFRNNSDIFKLNLVDLPSELVRPYRLTLDYAKISRCSKE